MKEYNIIRELYFTDEFWTFYHQQQDNVKYKFDYVFDIIRKEKIITSKFAQAFKWN